MTELIDNASQVFVLLLCCGFSGLRYLKSRRQAYFLLTCAYGCFALGGLYWTIYYFLFKRTPSVFYVSELAWCSGYIFICLLQYALSDREERAFRCRAAWLSPLIGIPLLVFYCTYGDVLLNTLISAAVMVMAWWSIRSLAYLRGAENGGKRRRFHGVMLAITAAEHGLWISSCFWVGDTLANPYFWFDFLLTALLLVLLPAVREAVEP